MSKNSSSLSIVEGGGIEPSLAAPRSPTVWLPSVTTPVCFAAKAWGLIIWKNCTAVLAKRFTLFHDYSNFVPSGAVSQQPFLSSPISAAAYFSLVMLIAADVQSGVALYSIPFSFFICWHVEMADFTFPPSGRLKIRVCPMCISLSSFLVTFSCTILSCFLC